MRTSIPPMSSYKWRGCTRPLLEFLKEGPKDWPSLNEWRRKNKVGDNLIRNMLAWLEASYEARTMLIDNEYIWCATNWTLEMCCESLMKKKMEVGTKID